MDRRGYELLDQDDFRIRDIPSAHRSAERVSSTLRAATRAQNPRDHLERFRSRVADLKARVDKAQRDRPPHLYQSISYCWDDDICIKASELPSPVRFAFLDTLYAHGALLNPDFFDHQAYESNGQPAMVEAVTYNDQELFDYLVSLGYPFGEPFDRAGNPLLGFAITSDRLIGDPALIEWIHRLIDCGDPVNGYRGTLVPALHSAVETEDAAAVAALLDRGADGYAADEDGMRASDYAITMDAPEALAALIEGGVDPRKGLVYFETDEQTLEERLRRISPVPDSIISVLATVRRNEVAESAKRHLRARTKASRRPL